MHQDFIFSELNEQLCGRVLWRFTVSAKGISK